MQGRGPAMLSALAANPKSVLMCAMGFGIIPLAVTAVYCGLYWEMWADSQDEKYDREINGVPVFDTCGIVDGDTQWTTLLAFNSILYLIMSILTILIMLSYFVPVLALIGGCCHSLACCAHLACIIVTGVFRYSDDGKKCAELTELGAKVNDDQIDFGARIQGLFISQCVIFCLYQCCIGCLSQVMYSVYILKKMGM